MTRGGAGHAPPRTRMTWNAKHRGLPARCHPFRGTATDWRAAYKSGSTARAVGNRRMRLKLERVGRRETSHEYGIFDEVTGKCVGTVSLERTPRGGRSRYPTRVIRLFDSVYTSSFNTHMECAAFVKGVEAVLSYILEAQDVNGLESALTNMLEAKEFEIPG
jgi:hypothetical protein